MSFPFFQLHGSLNIFVPGIDFCPNLNIVKITIDCLKNDSDIPPPTPNSLLHYQLSSCQWCEGDFDWKRAKLTRVMPTVCPWNTFLLAVELPFPPTPPSLPAVLYNLFRYATIVLSPALYPWQQFLP